MKKITRISALVMAILMAVGAFAMTAGAQGFVETGDADTNGTVNVKDATIIQKFSAELATLGDEYVADVNYDDDVNVKDATAVQKYVAGMGETIEEAAGVDLAKDLAMPTEPQKGEENSANDFIYKTLKDGTIKIVAYIGTDKTVTVPEKIDGKVVTALGKCAFSTALDLTNIMRKFPLLKLSGFPIQSRSWATVLLHISMSSPT